MRRDGETALQLTHQVLAADTEARAQVVRDNFSITAIYGWHLTTEQAYEAVSHVEADSIVFVEGHMRDQEYANRRLSLFVTLAEARLGNGLYGPETLGYRGALAAEFLLRQYSAPTEHDLYAYSLFEGLLGKDCILLPADYLNLDEHTPQLTSLEDLQEQLSLLFPISSEAALEAAIDTNAELLTRRLNNLVLREGAAFNLVLYFLSRYAGIPGLQSLSKRADGKTRAFLIYGLAHRDSLSANFEEHGIPVERILINSGDTPIDDQMNIAKELVLPPDQLRAILREHFLELVTQQET